MAWLDLVIRDRVVRRIALQEPVTTIGRGPDNDLVIDDAALSKHHARLCLRSGGWELVDLGSRNGIHVAGAPVRGRRLLRDGDTLTLGVYSFVLRAADSALQPAVRQVA